MFVKYPKVKRFGDEEVEGIEQGEAFIFPKIDGTNGSVWNENGTIKAGSRNRVLTLDNDNQGFYEHILNNKEVASYLDTYDNHRLFGEWLVPHSLKTYDDNAWRTFYVFDVAITNEEGGLEFIPYDIYKPLLDWHGIEYIPPMSKIKNPDYNSLIRELNKNNYLIKDGQGRGEGIVIKNYNYKNKYGRTQWAKIVTAEFKTKMIKAMGYNEYDEKTSIEEKIVEQFCTESFIEKEYAKIVNEMNGWKNEYIGRLLGTVYHELIVEELWNALKKYKNPTIDFKVLNNLVVDKVKVVKKEVFYG